MKSLKIIFTIIFLSICTSSFAGIFDDDSIKTVKYKGEKYEIRYNGDLCSIMNVKSINAFKNSTSITKFDGEEYLDWRSRTRQEVAKADSMIRSVIGMSYDKFHMATYYFDTSTHKYVGVCFVIPIKLMKSPNPTPETLRAPITISEIYEIEQNLLRMNFKVGKQKLIHPENKYFEM